MSTYLEQTKRLSATAHDIVDTYVAHHECGECGTDELIVERGGGIVSVSCPNCGFSASAEEDQVSSELDEFLETVGELEPADQRFVLLGVLAGGVQAVLLFFASFVLHGAADLRGWR